MKRKIFITGIAAPQGTNGKFLGAFGWTGTFASNVYRASVGNTDLGSMNFWDNGALILNLPHYTDRGLWTFTGRVTDMAPGAPGQLRFGYIDYDSGYGFNQLNATGQILTGTNWQNFTGDFGGVPPGDRISIYLQGWYSMADDVCPPSGCTMGTPTPSPTASPTSGPTATPGGNGFPYGLGTPLPIDWSRFPTIPPYPTFPPFPTQVAYPTPLYGLGTPQPITGSVQISGTVKIDDTTPVRVKIDDSTPVQITGTVKIDDRTPVRVAIAPDPNYTPLPYTSFASGVGQNAPAPGSGIPTLISSPSQSYIQYGQAGSAVNPLVFNMAQEDLETPAINIQPLGVNFIMRIHYIYPTAFSLVGIDILPGLQALAAVFCFVFIIRQLQAR